MLAELRQVHAAHVRSYHIINAISATVSSAEIGRLRASPGVRAVVPDQMRHFASLGSGAGPALPRVGHRGRHGLANTPNTQQICPSNPAQPLAEPEAREVMNVAAANQIVDGTGIKVGIIADGIDPNNPDLIRAGGQHVIFDFQDFSGFGPGASAPETSGTAALVDEAYANTHNGNLPSPALVERIIVSTAIDLGAPADHQGADLVNTLKAVQLAKSIGTSSPQGGTLLVNQTSLNATVNAGQNATFNVGVTNEGTGSQTVTPTVSGNPTTVSNDTGSITLSSSSPTYIDGEGRTDFYATHTFSVPAGAGNLNGDITWNALGIRGVAFETLFDPQGNVAAYSLIGTNQSGFGHVEVHNPMAGTWTAVIFTVSNAPYFGTVQFSYFAQNSQSAGKVSPSSLTLAPGQTGTFKVTATAGQAGDEGLKLHLGTGSGTDGSLPIIIRALVPLSSAGGSFNGSLTGGGASFNAGQEFTYQFKVQGNKPSLNLGVQLAHSNYGLEGFLIDPNGQPLDAQTTANDGLAPGPTMQFFHGSPANGLWTLVLLVALPVDGFGTDAGDELVNIPYSYKVG